jgi:hypothetical protein
MSRRVLLKHEKLVRRWNSRFICSACQGPCVVEEWECSKFNYHIYCKRCHTVRRRTQRCPNGRPKE